MQLADIVPWGRSYEEYVAMFALDEADLDKPILGCGDGPAAFNAIHTKAGRQVVSVDPIYGFAAAEIAKRISETYDIVLDQVRQKPEAFNWTVIPSVEVLGEIRLAAMQTFLADYELGKQDNRYCCAALPALPFADKQFSLALCSHLLFLYSEHLSCAFHLASIQELCRVAEEVRIFPVLDLQGNVSAHLEPVLRDLAAAGYRTKLAEVAYEFQLGGNQLLTVRSQ